MCSLQGNRCQFYLPQAVVKLSIPSKRGNALRSLRILNFAPPAVGKIGRGKSELVLEKSG